MDTQKKWIKHWAGHWNILYDTLLGFHNTNLMKEELGIHLQDAMYIYKNGYTFAYFDENTYSNFGKQIATIIENDHAKAEQWKQNLAKATDKIMKFMKVHIDTDFDRKTYNEYVRLFHEYNNWHRPVKVVVDFLSPSTLKKLFSTFEEARVYAEPVYKYTEEFVIAHARILGEKSGYPYRKILAMNKDEMSNYFETLELPTESILADRYTGCAIIFNNGAYTMLTGNDVLKIEIEVLMTHTNEEKIIKGKTAHPGIVTGKVQIIFDPYKANDFQPGNILVTGMTRPEFLPLMKKAGAFITDAGGMLSHAAITARELQKPCIVGTEVSTTLLKDGDIVEVNATKGEIRKIQSSS